MHTNIPLEEEGRRRRRRRGGMKAEEVVLEEDSDNGGGGGGDNESGKLLIHILISMAERSWRDRERREKGRRVPGKEREWRESHLFLSFLPYQPFLSFPSLPTSKPRGAPRTQWARPVPTSPTPEVEVAFLTVSSGEQRRRPRAMSQEGLRRDQARTTTT